MLPRKTSTRLPPHRALNQKTQTLGNEAVTTAIHEGVCLRPSLQKQGEIRMMLQKNVMKSSLAALAAFTLMAGSDASAQPEEHGQFSPRLAKDLGRVAAGEQSISVYLNLHDQAGFDQAVRDLYDPASANFHHWFTDADSPSTRRPLRKCRWFDPNSSDKVSRLSRWTR